MGISGCSCPFSLRFSGYVVRIAFPNKTSSCGYTQRFLQANMNSYLSGSVMCVTQSKSLGLHGVNQQEQGQP